MTFCYSLSHLWTELKDKSIDTKVMGSQKKKRVWDGLTQDALQVQVATPASEQSLG